MQKTKKLCCVLKFHDQERHRIPDRKMSREVLENRHAFLYNVADRKIAVILLT